MPALNTENSEIVTDPVSHISISGVHGRGELDDRLAHAPAFREHSSPLKPMLLGAAIGAALVYLWKR